MADSAILHDFGNLLLTSRKEAAEHYGVDTQEIFDRAFLIFESAMRADPTNWEMAADIAQSY